MEYLKNVFIFMVTLYYKFKYSTRQNSNKLIVFEFQLLYGVFEYIQWKHLYYYYLIYF